LQEHASKKAGGATPPAFKLADAALK